MRVHLAEPLWKDRRDSAALMLDMSDLVHLGCRLHRVCPWRNSACQLRSQWLLVSEGNLPSAVRSCPAFPGTLGIHLSLAGSRSRRSAIRYAMGSRRKPLCSGRMSSPESSWSSSSSQQPAAQTSICSLWQQQYQHRSATGREQPLCSQRDPSMSAVAGTPMSHLGLSRSQHRLHENPASSYICPLSWACRYLASCQGELLGSLQLRRRRECTAQYTHPSCSPCSCHRYLVHSRLGISHPSLRDIESRLNPANLWCWHF